MNVHSGNQVHSGKGTHRGAVVNDWCIRLGTGVRFFYITVPHKWWGMKDPAEPSWEKDPAELDF